MTRRFCSYKQSKLSVTRRKGRYSAVKSCQLSWAGQYKQCVQYVFKFTAEYSDVFDRVFLHIYKVPNVHAHGEISYMLVERLVTCSWRD